MSNISITNPSNPAIAPAGVPATLPPLPAFPKSNSAVVKQVGRLHAQAAQKTANIRKVRDAQGEAFRALREAQAALQAQITKGASSGEIDTERELELSLKVSAAERLAATSVHTQRQRVAVQEQREAVEALRRYVAEHAAELYEELRPEAEQATAELVKAEESIQRQRERHRAAQEASQQLGAIIATAAGPDAQSVSYLLRFPVDSASVPMPSDEALATLDRKKSRELVTLDAD